MKRKTLGLVFAVLGVGIVFFAIFRGGGGGGEMGLSAKTQVRVRLKWIHQGQFAGFYCAQQNGFYREEGIEVELRSGGPNENAIRLIASGTDDIGVWGADQIMIGRSQDLKLKAIGVVYKQTAACFVTRKESGIERFKDIEGKRVGTQVATDLETIYTALVAINGVDRSTVRETNVSFNFSLFLGGAFDVWPSYVINEPYIAEKQGVPVHIIYPKDNGLNFYGDTIFCHEDLLNNHPDTVIEFCKKIRYGQENMLT